MAIRFDEAVALVEIIKLIQGDPAYQRYDRIVFDTAPTGHTLRLLALPDFMDSFLGKILSMKAKFGSMMNNMKSMLGGGGADGMQMTLSCFLFRFHEARMSHLPWDGPRSETAFCLILKYEDVGYVSLVWLS